jgi:hypothetical protein
MTETTVALLIACLSALTSIVTLVVSMRTENQRVSLQSDLETNKEIREEKRKFLYQQMEEFYDPIFSLLSINKEIFEKIGPSSAARWNNNFPEKETAVVWSQLVSTVVSPNNIRICSIVESKLHLVTQGDDIKNYLEFITHANAYKVFGEHPYEAYKLFQFPKGFYEHVESQRNQLRKKMDKILS